MTLRNGHQLTARYTVVGKIMIIFHSPDIQCYLLEKNVCRHTWVRVSLPGYCLMTAGIVPSPGKIRWSTGVQQRLTLELESEARCGSAVGHGGHGLDVGWQ